MNHVNFFRDLFKTIEGYRKIVLLMFSVKNDNDFLTAFGF